MQNYADVSDFLSGALPEAQIKALVPLDGSSQAERALEYVKALSVVGAVHVKLLAVVDELEEVVYVGERQERLERQRHLMASYLNERVARLDSGLASVESVVIQGLPARTILEEAERWRANLIVISSHSRSGIQRWRLGSVADKVVRGAPCDVLVVGGAAEPADGISSVLVPLDGSPLAERALPMAVRLATALGSQLHVARVVTPPIVGQDVTGFTYTTPDLIDALMEGAESYVTNVKAKTNAAEAATLFGGAAESLLDYITSKNIRLVVMTSHGRGGVLRAALGSVTDRLLGGPAPVLVVHVPAEEGA
jgi:nucleotide-binding universal stress UspA family protein